MKKFIETFFKKLIPKSSKTLAPLANERLTHRIKIASDATKKEIVTLLRTTSRTTSTESAKPSLTGTALLREISFNPCWFITTRNAERERQEVKLTLGLAGRRNF